MTTLGFNRTMLRAAQLKLHSMFFGLFLKIALSAADVIWPPLDYYLWGARDNIREAIGEIQLHTIDNMLINWIDRIGYCMVSQGSRLNEIIFRY